MSQSRPDKQTALSVSEILSGYRDLGSAWRPKDEIYLSCDPAFNRYTRLWVKGPTLDATHGALEALMLLGRSPFDEGKIYQLLQRQFLPETGTFATDGGPASGGIYGLHNAIGILKSLHGLPPRKALGLSRYEEALERIGRQDPQRDLEHFKLFLRQCVASGPTPGGLVDHPAMEPYIPTVTTLHTATSTLWNLWEDDCRAVLAEIIPVPEIERFILDCLQETSVGQHEIAAFSVNPQVSELCTNTTFFALETLWHLENEKVSSGQDLLSLEQRDKIIRFLIRVAWVEGDGGFRSTVGEIPSLNATFFGLRALRRLSRTVFSDFVEARLDSICRFVESCADRGGYAFTNCHDRYLPTPLATRYALQIRELLAKKNFEDSEAPLPAASGDSRIAEFLQNELLDPETGAYHGYPPNRIRGAERFDTQELYFWDPEKAEHRATDAKKLFRLLADGLEKAWSVDRDPVVFGDVKEVRLRDGSMVSRRERLLRKPESPARYGLRKTTDGPTLVRIEQEPTDATPDAAKRR